MKKTVLLCIAATVIIGCLLTSTWGQAQRQGDKTASPTPFKGQVVVISSKGTSETGAALSNPIMKKIGDREFLVGVGIDSGQPDDWLKGHKVWVAMDDVAQLVEYEDVDEVIKSRGPYRSRLLPFVHPPLEPGPTP